MTEQIIRARFQDLRQNCRHGFDDQLVDFFEPDEELVYQVRVPASASGGETNVAEAPGVFIYISPKPGARMPEDWGAVLDKHNLIWVGAENSGNEVHVARRVGYALLAMGVAEQIGDINPARGFLTGFSGGGRVASMMLPVYSARFSGALFICGANGLGAAPQEELRDRPMVFLTGSDDFNLEDTKMAVSSFVGAGLARAELMVVEGLGHALPSAGDLDRAIESMHSPT